MIASVLWMGAQWFVGALVVFTILVAPVLLMMQLLTLASRRRRATKPTKPFAWREEPRPGTGTVRNPITGKLWYVENGKPMREVEEDRSADVVGLLREREERMRNGHPAHDPVHPNPLGLPVQTDPSLPLNTIAFRDTQGREFGRIINVVGDPEVVLNETEIERIERHRRMQIGEFSPRHRHES